MDPCKRHRYAKPPTPAAAMWTPVTDQRERYWAIAVARQCVTCGHTTPPRMVEGTLKPTQREAMLAYGLPLAMVDAFCPPPPPWPFPHSSRGWHKPGT